MKKLISTIVLMALLLTIAAPALAASKIYATGNANIRSGPGLGYSKIGSVKKGASLPYLDSSKKDSRGVRWYKVSYSGKTGWISSKYSSTKKPGSGSGSGSSSGTTSAKTIYATGSANVRSGPSLSASKIGSVEKGTALKCKGKTSTDDRGVKWYQVTFKGKTGWISSKYSSTKKPGSSSSSSTVKPKTSASNKVTATASVNLRKGPGLSYGKIATVAKGSTLKYLGSTKKDSRGVKWYKVSYDGKTVWISSKYSKLTTSGSSKSSASSSSSESTAGTDSTATPDLTNDAATGAEGFGVTPVTTAPENYVELSGFYQAELIGTAVMLSVDDFQQVDSEVPNQYSNDVLTIAGNTDVEYMRVHGEGYTIYGVCVGMDIESAKALLAASGLQQVDNSWITAFQHPASETSSANVDGFDSSINLYTDLNGNISELEWSTYSE